jgi:hypothetical protein
VRLTFGRDRFEQADAFEYSQNVSRRGVSSPGRTEIIKKYGLWNFNFLARGSASVQFDQRWLRQRQVSGH